MFRKATKNPNAIDCLLAFFGKMTPSPMAMQRHFDRENFMKSKNNLPPIEQK